MAPSCNLSADEHGFDADVSQQTAQLLPEFDLLEDALSMAYDDAELEGYGISIRRSLTNATTGEKRKVILMCCRRGKAKEPLMQQLRASASSKCDCQWEAHIDKDPITKRWAFTRIEQDHNHDPTDEISAIASARNRRLDEAMLLKISNFSSLAPRDILYQLRKDDPNCIIQIEDIYNARKELKIRRVGSYSPSQYLLSQLKREEWHVEFETDCNTNEIQKVFFANKHVYDVLKANPEVVQMDCTYKTNRYKMPLLVIVGQTCLGSSFYVAFAFLGEENEESFAWALTQLKRLYAFLGLSDPRVVVTDRDIGLMKAVSAEYPDVHNLLCMWHINMNVLKKCRKAFETTEEWKCFNAAWQKVVYAPTRQVHDAAWEELQNSYSGTNATEVAYLQDTWLEPWRHRFCKFQTDQVLHFGTLTTSRVEGSHAVLKRELRCSTGDLLDVVDGIKKILNEQYQNHKHRLAKSRMRPPSGLPRKLCKDLLGRVSSFALLKILQQYQMVTKATQDPVHHPLTACTGTFTATMGLPCAHHIKDLMQSPDQSLSLDKVDQYWQYQRAAVGPQDLASTSVSQRSLPRLSAELPTLPRGSHVDQHDHQFDNGHEECNLSEISEMSSLPELDDLVRNRRATSAHGTQPLSHSDSESSLDSDLLAVNEPRVVRPKGRPRGALGKRVRLSRTEISAARSTKRDLSGHEHALREVDAAAKRARRAPQSRGRGIGRGRVREINCGRLRMGQGPSTAPIDRADRDTPARVEGTTAPRTIHREALRRAQQFGIQGPYLAMLQEAADLEEAGDV